MPSDHESVGARLVGRRDECEALDRLIADVRVGRSRAIVLRGEAGVGKSALLGYLFDRVTGWRVARAVGVEWEMELAYSGLHQICAHMLDRLDRLPDPQRDALETVFGLSVGPAPERFLVGLATLTLFAEVAEERPLVCIVDDAQWLDQASAQVIGFVARRFFAERVALVCAARTGVGDDVLAELPELLIRGLGDSDARALLLDHMHGPLDAAICEQIISESHGNPLALLELPRTWNPAELAGGFGLPGSQPVAGKIERSYARRLLRLPPNTRLLVLAAAAEPLGDPMLLHRAAASLGIDMASADLATDAGLLKIGGRVEFAHPLIRSAAYRSAAAADRHGVHRALAEATDGETDPDRRAWHLAAAAVGPDEQTALGLELSAERAQTRGGLAAAAAFLRRAVALTGAPARRAERALAAAQASLQAGAFDAALEMLAIVESTPLDARQRARVELLRGQVTFAQGLASDAVPLLMAAAERLTPLDLELARETYLMVCGAAWYGGPASADLLLAAGRAARALPRPVGTPRAVDTLLDGIALLVTEGRAAAAPTLLRATSDFSGDDVPVDECLRWGWFATAAPTALWDDDGLRAMCARQIQVARDAGALGQIPSHLIALSVASARSGDFASAASLMAEATAITDATGTRLAPYAEMVVLAMRGSEAEAEGLIEATIEKAADLRQGIAADVARWAAAILYNGIGRYEDAREAATAASSTPLNMWSTMWSLPELVEAAARTGAADVARQAVERLTETTRPASTDFGLGVEARSRALVSEGEAAEELYREAIDRLRRTRLRADLARSHLLYGEWLRREGRRRDAREQLREAHGMFTDMGVESFAERARRELVATGATVHKRRTETRDELTPQEHQIARLARDGLSNPEIGARLFLSSRTVEWHLRKVFPKLGISSRRQLRNALSEGGRVIASA